MRLLESPFVESIYIITTRAEPSRVFYGYVREGCYKGHLLDPFASLRHTVK